MNLQELQDSNQKRLEQLARHNPQAHLEEYNPITMLLHRLQHLTEYVFRDVPQTEYDQWELEWEQKLAARLDDTFKRVASKQLVIPTIQS